MLKQFRVGKNIYGFVESKNGFIITETDFFHWISFDLTDSKTIELSAGYVLSDDNHLLESYETLTLDQIRALCQPMDIAKFGHYWGIKDRVRANYHLLLKSMKIHLELDTSDMPEWGDK